MSWDVGLKMGGRFAGLAMIAVLQERAGEEWKSNVL